MYYYWYTPKSNYKFIISISSNALTRNETTLPSSFTSSSLTSLGTIASLNTTRLASGKTHTGYSNLELKANQSYSAAVAISPKTDNTESSIYFNPSPFSGFTTGTTGTWVVGTNVAENAHNRFVVYNPSTATQNFSLAITGQGNFSHGLSISGVLQSPLTSLLGVSVGNSLTRNETTLPSSFTSSSLNNFTNNIFANNTKLIIGTTGTPLSYVKQLINSTDGTAQTEYRGTNPTATGVLTFGLAHSYGDAYLQLQYASINQPLQFQNLTGGNITLGTTGVGGYKTITMDNTGSLYSSQ